jgi:hypothetical protein
MAFSSRRSSEKRVRRPLKRNKTDASSVEQPLSARLAVEVHLPHLKFERRPEVTRKLVFFELRPSDFEKDLPSETGSH